MHFSLSQNRNVDQNDQMALKFSHFGSFVEIYVKGITYSVSNITIIINYLTILFFFFEDMWKN